MHSPAVPTCAPRASRGPTAGHIRPEHSSALLPRRRLALRISCGYHRIKQQLRPQMIVWPVVRPLLPRYAQIVARLIRNRRPLQAINRGAGATPSSSSHSPPLTTPRSSARRAHRPRAGPLDAENPRRDEDLAVDPRPARRRRAAEALPVRTSW